MKTHNPFALITGASSGIGWQFAEALAKKGYSIVGVSNQQAELKELKKKLEDTYRVGVLTMDIDLSQENAAQQVFDYCKGQGLAVEVLINNAGMFTFGEVARTDYDRMSQILGLHVATPALLCRLFGEQMMERKKGFILNVSSITSVMPYPGISLYGPTKAFLRHFTRALRTEMEIYGVRVTCLIPGPVDTRLFDPGNFSPGLLKRLGVLKSPATVANAGVRALFHNRAECIPGLLNKWIVWFLPLLPYFIIRMVNRRTGVVRIGG